MKEATLRKAMQEFLRRAAKARWRRTTKAQRVAHGKMMAAARWGKARVA